MPRLLADDETEWASKWRGLKAARRQRLLDELDELGIDTWGLAGRADMVLERDDVLADLAEPGDDFEFDANGELMLEPDGASDFDGGFGPNSYFGRAMRRDD